MTLVASGVMLDYRTLERKIGAAGVKKIKKIFTIVTLGHNNTSKMISACKIIGTAGNVDGPCYISIPRFGGFMLQRMGIVENINNRLLAGEDRDFSNAKYILTDNQAVILGYLMKTIYTPENIKLGSSSTILQMDPGHGKTYQVLGLMSRIKKKTFIIVPNTYLLKQWGDIVSAAFPSLMVGYYYGTKKVDGDIIISIINSALNYKEYSKCGLIVYDEVHMYCSKKFASIFSTAQAACCIGITATPFDRIDKFDPVAHWALGQVIKSSSVPGWNTTASEFNTKVTRVIYGGPPEHTKVIESAAGIVSVPLMINQLQLDPHRNALIVAYAIKMYLSGLNVFIFSDRREHLHLLAKLLEDAKICFEAPELNDAAAPELNGATMTTIKKLMGGSTDEDIKMATSVGRIIMTTYQYSGTGVSINKMNALILATPRKSGMKQILGRIYRLSGDQSITRRIVDIVDNRICLKSQFYVRKKTYIDILKGTSIVDHNIKWESAVNVKTALATLNALE